MVLHSWHHLSSSRSPPFFNCFNCFNCNCKGFVHCCCRCCRPERALLAAAFLLPADAVERRLGGSLGRCRCLHTAVVYTMCIVCTLIQQRPCQSAFSSNNVAMAQRARWREEAYYYANETQTVVSRPIANGVTRGLLGYVFRPRSPLLHIQGCMYGRMMGVE